MSRIAEKMDARVRRTRDALGDALIELIQEKPFESITIGDVLDRAGVGRSTFYVHYKDKDDLLWSDAEEFLELMSGWLSRKNETSERVAPVRELFAHVAEGRRIYEAFVAMGRAEEFHQLARGCFARGIDARLAQIPRSMGLLPAVRGALAHALSGAMMALLESWLREGATRPAAEMDDLFHRLVWGGAQNA
jgi:AcrR family transcriptional regulator